MKERLMKIVHATSELFPYAKTGGLADMVGSLTTAQQLGMKKDFYRVKGCHGL
jgi:glycogen synthase